MAFNEVAHAENWTFLGYDVGEYNHCRWSAILKYYDYTSYEEMEQWLGYLNTYGLFSTLEDAQKFRAFYLNSEDPILKEEQDAVKEELYQVVGIYIFNKKRFF